MKAGPVCSAVEEGGAMFHRGTLQYTRYAVPCLCLDPLLLIDSVCRGGGSKGAGAVVRCLWVRVREHEARKSATRRAALVTTGDSDRSPAADATLTPAPTSKKNKHA